MDNLMALTKDMEKAIVANDLDTLGAILTMRQKSMDQIDAFNLDIRKTLKGMKKAEREKAVAVLDAEREPEKFNNPLEANIYEANKATLSLVQKVIRLDQALNQRMQGGG